MGSCNKREIIPKSPGPGALSASKRATAMSASTEVPAGAGRLEVAPAFDVTEDGSLA